MTSGIKTRNPLVLFEGNDNAVARTVARNPITQSDVAFQTWTPKKTIGRNPILQVESNFLSQTSQKPQLHNKNKTITRNPIIADPNEFAVRVRDNNTYKDSDIFGSSKGDLPSRPQTTKAKHNATFSSTVFGGPKIEAAVTDLSTDQLFGDYREPPVKKTQPKQYNPNFVNESPEQRRYKEVFGNEKPPSPALNPKNLEIDRNEEFNEKDAFSKKVTNLESNIFNVEERRPQTSKAVKPKEKFFAKSNWNSQTSAATVDNQRKDIDTNYAKNKKQEEFIKSNIFGQTQDNLVFLQKPSELKDDSNVDKRKMMRNYSDLFNLPQYENPNSGTLEKKKENDEHKKIVDEDKNLDAHEKRLKDLYSVLANEDLTKAYKESLNSAQLENKDKEKNFTGQNAKDLKKMELQSNMLGNQNKDVNYDNIKDPVYFDLDVKGVNQDFDEGEFKNFCATKGYHLVDFKPNMNSLNTGNDGTGRLKIRLGEAADMKVIKSKLREMGLNTHVHTEKHELKHNYVGVAKLDWKDANLAGEERRLHGNDFVDAKDSKMRDLESNGDIFGSSKGVGQWDPEWKTMNKNKKALENNYTPEDNVQALNWKKAIKNLDKSKNPMYKAGTSFQNQRLFSSTSSKIVGVQK